ncbi:MAG: cellulase family glycosylhydrolase [Chitinophagales bacterium]|nr:cellulase family glycosylhydrolase [Chitinophagales bacterium]
MNKLIIKHGHYLLKAIKFQLSLLFISSILFLVACKKEKNETVEIDSKVFLDQYGREQIFHGASLYTNDDPQGYSRYNSYSARRLINEWGLNSVRMFWNWNAIEPDSAVFAMDRIDSIVKVVETFTNEGIYVVLAVNGTATSSQDKLEGTWQTPYGNAVNIPELPGNTNPAKQEATRRFWDYKNHPYLQDEFIKASKLLAERFKNNKYVLGYDIINEPWGDDVIGTVLNINLETKLLPDFYEKYISELRKVETEKYIFFEPSVLFNHKEVSNFVTKLPVINDIFQVKKRLAFAPHCYLINQSVNSIRNNYSTYLSELKKKYIAVQKKQNVPLYIGEWSNINFSTFTDAENYLIKHLEAFDEIKASWSYFGYFPSNPNDEEYRPDFDVIARVYPRAVAGKILSYSFNEENKLFVLKYINDNTIHQASEIFIPKVKYPNGWTLEVDGVKDYSYTFDDIKGILSFSTNVNSEITIRIITK